MSWITADEKVKAPVAAFHVHGGFDRRLFGNIISLSRHTFSNSLKYPDKSQREQGIAYNPCGEVQGRDILHRFMMSESQHTSKRKVSEPFMERVIQELEKYQNDQRQCVIIMHGFLELLVNALIEAKCKNGKRILESGRDYPHSTKLVLLHELGIINDSQFTDFNWFRKLRNKAAHEALFALNAQDLQSFKGTKFENPESFCLLCMDLFIEFWNEHLKLFAPKFSASAADESIQQSTQESNLLGHTVTMVQDSHLVARVSFQRGDNELVQYQYDHYPDIQRIIIRDGGTYVRKRRRAWTESNDWGESCKPIESDLSQCLDELADNVHTPLQPPRFQDESQGKMVWKLLEQSGTEQYDTLDLIARIRKFRCNLLESSMFLQKRPLFISYSRRTSYIYGL